MQIDIPQNIPENPSAEVVPIVDEQSLNENQDSVNFVDITNSPQAFDVNMLLAPATALKQSANLYFTKGNTFGPTSSTLTSCSLLQGMFSDNSVKKHISAMDNITDTKPMCALGSEDNSKKGIVTKYLVYVPIDQSTGFCTDSTGAAIMVTSVPKSLSCVSSL
jgi:hypothetical protein